jgi:hypothetical protein
MSTTKTRFSAFQSVSLDNTADMNIPPLLNRKLISSAQVVQNNESAKNVCEKFRAGLLQNLSKLTG